MFGRGSWAIFGVDRASLSTFRDGLGGEALIKVLQSTVLRDKASTGGESWGMNPPLFPRLDEGELQSVLDEKDFLLYDNVYGFWAIWNGGKDVSDAPSKEEAIAYKEMKRPFRFLTKKEKATVEEQVISSAVMSRKQFPVIVDFQYGRVYAESTSRDDLLALRAVLDNLGAETFSLCWSFGSADWPSSFLGKIHEGSGYSSQMRSRADELAKSPPSEVGKLEDKEMEKIVSSYFSFTLLENGLVACLGCPSQVRIHPMSDPVGVADPSVAFSLLEMTDDSAPAGASLTIVEPVIKKTKGGGEKTVNKPVLSVDINPNVNNFDAGAALLRGFDLPNFKRSMKVLLKAKGNLEIKDFWTVWLTSMHDAVLTIADSITNVLGLDGSEGKTYGLAVIATGADSTEIEVKEE